MSAKVSPNPTALRTERGGGQITVRCGYKHDVRNPRAPMNMWMFFAAPWRATPASMITAPMKSVGRRPRMSAANGVNGRP